LNRLLHGPVGTPLTLSIGVNTLPYFVASHAVTVTKATLLLRAAASQTVNKVSITIDGTAVSDFAADPTMGGLWSSDVTAIFSAGLFGDHSVTIADAGDLAAAAPQPVVSAAIDTTKLLDILLYVESTLADS
jgi:hypothetical protein